MMTLVGRRLSHYELMMRKAADDSFDVSEDFLCRCCEHHRPDWEYRFCEFTECPYMKGVKTFWEKAYDDGS